MFGKILFICTLIALITTAHASNPLLPVAEIKYYGVCDGSAAVKLDKQTLLIANDENNLLISYDIWGGKPVASFDLASILENLNMKNGKDRELDIEAAAVFDNKIWWIASHGRNKSGKKRPNRRSFFSTNIPDRDLQEIKIIDKRIDLAPMFNTSPETKELITKDVLKTPPKEGGLNIEAMAFTPTGQLLVGFRSPLTGDEGTIGDAILVRLEGTDGGWKIAGASELNLNDKGFRDLIPYGSGYLMIAGNVESGGKFALHSLDSQNKPSKLSKIKPKSLNPEALVALNKQLLILSDDGGMQRASKDDDNENESPDCKEIMGQNIDTPSEDTRVYFRGMVFDLETAGS